MKNIWLFCAITCIVSVPARFIITLFLKLKNLSFHDSETSFICLFHLQTCPSSFSFSVILSILLLYILFLQWLCYVLLWNQANCPPTLGCLPEILVILSNGCLLFDLSTDILLTHTICFLIFQASFSFSTSLNPPKWSPLSKVKGVFLMSYWLTNLAWIFLLYFHNMVVSCLQFKKEKKKRKQTKLIFSLSSSSFFTLTYF